MSNTLSQTLENAGKTAETLTLADGAALVLLPYGARGLGLFAAGSNENFFWTNPALRTGCTAEAMFRNSGWHNTGGDRTWIAPELDVFFTDAAATQYVQPRALDMSDYLVERVGGGRRLSREMTLHLVRPDRAVRLRLDKWFAPAANPLRYEKELADVVGSVEYAGYVQRITLEAIDQSATNPPALGIWNLLQLPPGGEMIVPWYAASVPQKCFGDLPAACVTFEDRAMRIRVDFPGSHKIALQAASLCGRAGYVYGGEERCSLVVRNFAVNPSGRYVDVAKHAPDDEGYAFQMCRVDEAEMGSFCELEYHVPALGSGPEPARSDDVSQTWAFRGPRPAIARIARRLLGTEVEQARCNQ